ncbi:putative TetR family regulatory protein [Asanoa ishikariensis]|uniref:Transcriptional regulator, TetR family n=1 Tax=Asanoa ishikariensis TaxID=137265 RepID=A0A1H3UXQ0_9ACTN|nr:TetR family transcriptional regulator [Asanoa ishikariensis]GIF70004.1 putative TetR family regulatory protein [Asanoa ishikariensis]SDZ67222.1 transcriptional regulator, TetR family [Asanoa ishikariensis]
MPYDSSATRDRLIEAAYWEFAEFGLAGGRVDRIATAAGANKQAIYAYYGSKENLFDAMLLQRIDVLSDTVPFDPGDLPGYAGALFDALNATPELLRLTSWRMLERDDAPAGWVSSHLAKASELRAASRLPDDATALDVLEIVIAISSAWVGLPSELRSAGGTAPTKRQKAHRAMVVQAVTAIQDALLKD